MDPTRTSLRLLRLLRFSVKGLPIDTYRENGHILAQKYGYAIPGITDGAKRKLLSTDTDPVFFGLRAGHAVNLQMGSPTVGHQCQQTRHLRLYREKTVRAMYLRGRSFDRIHYEWTGRRNQMLEWNYRSEIFAFSRRLNENLSEDTLRQIFTHPSYERQLRDSQVKLNLPEINIQSNGELVKLGRETLERVLKPYLRHTFVRVPEDGIDQITAYLASDETLADVAKWIGCKEVILSSEYPPSEATMADTVRALVGGIQTEEPSKTRRFIVDIIISYLNDKDILDDVWIIPNPRATLNLILANSQLPAYEPRVMFQTGRDTIEACHVVGLYTNQKLLGSGPGETLAIAEDCAALDALQKLFDLTEDRAPFVYGEASDAINLDNFQKKHHYVKTWSFKLD